MIRCYKCQHELQIKETPGRSSTCPYCQADLHCCFNCRHYSPTSSQQCLSPTVEPVKNKAAANFCDEFRLREFHKQTTESADESAKKRWEDLFRNL